MTINRARRNANEWQSLIEQQRQSGLSAPAFCKENDIGYPSFMKWRQQLSETTTPQQQSPSAFVEVSLTESSTDLDSPWLVELDLGANVHLRIAQPG